MKDRIVARYRALRRAAEAQGKLLFMGYSDSDKWLECHFRVNENDLETPRVCFWLGAHTDFKDCFVSLVWPDGRTVYLKDKLERASGVQIIAAGLELAAKHYGQ